MNRTTEKELLERLSRCDRIIMTEEVMHYILNHPQPKISAKMLHDIMLLNEFGLSLPDRYIHRIWESSEKLWELRTKFARYDERTLFFSVLGDKFLLTNCFRKTSNKVPRSEIRKAENILRRFLQTRREGK
ncbi:type II toxin-antitoxin system RelE/ParE family toxin [Desulfofundulus thermosubterraneus]|uniref:Phage derived protein Gp49-like n=1 Tax=Desulfofundulus thermosubterraneus DSM 16057 TaxID=1121432 RepID=A0A1M6H0B1_9FIRM|nr:type II toxin-antitoxin system RelE/ParE family toxin [Desulfofundulus thermosubterraneus]SHJ15601.1 Phage derived protein Gp49-like [Desulfofundulus thermosubterraneus DSM 16057]